MFEAHLKYKIPASEARILQKAPKLSIPEAKKLDLLERELRFILFGGKGGCGKTTCSAAAGIYMAKHGRKTLVISTDPQHSLPGSFDQRIGEDITPIEGVDNLYALEINASKLYEEWIGMHKGDILEIATSATILDREDAAGFFDESLGPGLDEFMALLKIAELIERGGYDLYILDTAPTGHTLRLLELPDFMSKIARMMVKLRIKTQYIVQSFFGRRIRERPDIFLEKLLSDVGRVKATIKDPRLTEFILVTTLDQMAVMESERLVAVLRQSKIPIRRVIINGIIPPNPGCNYCVSRVKIQQRQLENAYKKFAGLEVVQASLFPYEIRGIMGLTEFSEALFSYSKEDAG